MIIIDNYKRFFHNYKRDYPYHRTGWGDDNFIIFLRNAQSS